MSRKRQERGQKRARQAPAALPRTWWLLPLFLCLVCAIKVIVLAQLQDHPLIQPDGGVDAAAYVRLARDVLNGHAALGPGLYYLSPLYIYFLATVLALTDSFTAVRLVQVVLGTAAVWCIFSTTQIWFSRRAAWIAAGLAALTGLFTFYEILILQASLDTSLTAAALLCLAVALRHASEAALDVPSKAGRWILAAGVVWGVQTLNRPNVLVAAIGIVVAIVVVMRQPRLAALLAAGLAIGVAPVVARNAIVSHQLALSSSHGGLNLYIGNNADATGQYGAVPGVRGNVDGQAEDTRKVAEQAVGHPLSDADVSAYFTRLALDWVRGHPKQAATLFARKLALVFNARHQWLDFSYPYYAYDTGSILAFLFVGPWLLVPLGLAGIVLGAGSSRSNVRAFLVWSAFVPLYAIGVAVFFVAERYRLPLFVPLCVCSAGALDDVIEAVSASARGAFVARRRSIVAIATGVAAGGLVAWPFPLNNGRYDERLMLSKVLMNRHDYGAAAIELQTAHDLQPGNTVTEFNLGMAQVSSGRIQDGLGHVRHAVEAGVPVPGARYALAGVMLQTGDRDGAVALLRTYSPASDDSAESCYQVAVLAMNAGAPRVAARYAQRALELRPGWPEALEILQRLR